MFCGASGTTAASIATDAGLRALCPAAFTDLTLNWYWKPGLKIAGYCAAESLKESEIPA